MRGGQNKAKLLPQPPALTRWPKAPTGFNKRESVAWASLGEALLPLGTVSESDLLLVELTARVRARRNDALADDDLKVSTVNSLVRLEADLLNRLGLSPQARATVGRLPPPKSKAEDPLDEFA